MPDSYYPIIPVTIADVEDQADEQLGTKKKLWVLRDDGQWWLYKQARPDTPGEAWAEKIAAEIAELIGVSHADIELAEETNDGLGTISPSFVPPGAELKHGNDILPDAVPGYDPHLRFGQREHSVANIVKALRNLAAEPGIDFNLELTLTAMAEYAVFDGLISNSDRHHENWALLYDTEQHTCTLAPSYDHATSLGRNLTDDDRNRRLNNKGGVLDYLVKRPGRTFVDPSRKSGPSPLLLAQLICLTAPTRVRPLLERLGNTPDRDFRNAINRIPNAIMSRTAKKFAHQAVQIGKTELLRNFR